MNNNSSPQITEHEKTMTYEVGNGQAQKCGGFKPVGCQPCSLDIESPMAIQK
jgi:hypothetical protein